MTGGSVQDNRLRGAQGTRVMNCLSAADYVVDHAIDVRLQSGYLARVVDFTQVCP